MIYQKVKVCGLECKVTAKIKGLNAYVVMLESQSMSPMSVVNSECNLLRTKYGSPIRHLKLEWGKFSGKYNEFIVSFGDIEYE